MSHEYFFELLVEEIPAWMLPHQGLRDGLEQLCKTDLGIDPATSVTIGATPRRLFFRLAGLPEKQPDRRLEVKGPPIRASFDDKGEPTQALQGFLKKNNATMENVVRGEQYVTVEKTVEGRAIGEILAEKLPALISGLRWPKMMRWGRGEHSFIRPVHSIVSIFDGKPVPIELFGVRSSNVTTGHRVLAPGTLEVASYDDYIAKLKLAGVVALESEREKAMRERCRELAKQAGGTPREDASIWEQWRYLTEQPGIVLSSFREEFLAIPEEVLVMVMRVHQKQLPILKKDGSLSNSYLSVMDNSGDPDGNAAHGNSFVTNARFADAKFFHDTDRKRTLESRVDDLSHLQFQEKLGDYLAKTKRIETIARDICLATRRDGNDVVLAARLSKTDLMTDMVKEFTELQGQVGGIYARAEGLPEPVWQAIYDQYKPVSVDDPLPRGAAGAIVSLADRIDTLVGFFRIGARPTGSKDPFALRRAAQGLVQILLNNTNWEIAIGPEQLVDIAISVHGSGADAKGALLEFLAERVRTILEAAPWGFAYDEIAAAMEARWADSLTDLCDRIVALRSIRNEQEFLSILDSAKRIANIVGTVHPGAVSASRLEHPTEVRLHELTLMVGEQIDELVTVKDYRAALDSFAGMAPELEKFFVDVMVMVEDPAVRDNRMALLLAVGRAAGKIADVTKIVVDRRELKNR
ncbi:MAG: glycine--tRNA ligase subunit beta [Thermoanaerobaculia bacterium]